MTPVSISRKDLNDSLKEVSRNDVVWKEINGVMVPVSFGIRMLNKQKYPKGYDLKLEWSHVNEPLDSKVFTPAGITESCGALVADMRLGQVVVEQINPLPVPIARRHRQSKTSCSSRPLAVGVDLAGPADCGGRVCMVVLPPQGPVTLGVTGMESGDSRYAQPSLTRRIAVPVNRCVSEGVRLSMSLE